MRAVGPLAGSVGDARWLRLGGGSGLPTQLLGAEVNHGLGSALRRAVGTGSRQNRVPGALVMSPVLLGTAGAERRRGGSSPVWGATRQCRAPSFSPSPFPPLLFRWVSAAPPDGAPVVPRCEVCGVLSAFCLLLNQEIGLV